MTSVETKLSLPTIVNEATDNNVLSFTLQNINVSLANAIRRTILTDIPTAVVVTAPYEKNQADIKKNTSRLNNEILKHRLSSIPIHINDKSIDLSKLMIVIHKKNEDNTMINVTTKDFKIKNIETDKYLPQSNVNKIFPPDPLTKYHILFTRLRPKISDEIPGEEIFIEAKMSIGTAAQDGTFNVVSTGSYSFTPDLINQRTILQKLEKEWKKSGLTGDEIDFEKENWRLLDGKRIYIKNSFDFIIETIGVFSNKYIVKQACLIIARKLEAIGKSVDAQTIEIKEGITASPTFDIVLQNEDYTIGKSIEYALHQLFYENESIFDFVGFRKLHPHDSDSIIRVAFAKEGTKNDLYGYLQVAVQSVIQIFEHVNKMF